MGIQYSPKIVTDGLVLCLDARNTKSYSGSGTIWNDLSGNNYNGTLTNSPLFVSGTLSFDGINDYIALSSPGDRFSWTPSGVGMNSMSIELWIKSSDTNGYYISKPWNGGGEYNYTVTHNAFNCRVGSSGVGGENYGISFSSLATDRWEHIVCVATPTQMGVYRSGIINANLTNHNITKNIPNSNSNLSLSLMTLYPYGEGWAGITSHAISGNMANFKLYNRLLSASEVLQNYNAIKGRFGL